MLSDSRDVGIKGSHGRTPFRGRTELRLWSDGVKGSRQPFLLVVGGSRAAPFHGYAAGFARLKIKKDTERIFSDLPLAIRSVSFLFCVAVLTRLCRRGFLAGRATVR